MTDSLNPAEARRLPTEHTRYSGPQGPDWCNECSNSAQAYVGWPCAASVLAAALAAHEGCVPREEHERVDGILAEWRSMWAKNQRQVEALRAENERLVDALMFISRLPTRTIHEVAIRMIATTALAASTSTEPQP